MLHRCLSALALLSAPVLFAQNPVVTSVVNEVTGDARLSPGGRALVYYTPPNQDFRSTVSVQVGGHAAHVLNSGAPADVLLPREVPPGPATLVISTNAGVSAPFNITLDRYSPGVWNAASSYCAWSDPAGAYLNAIGLGPTDPLLPTSDERDAPERIPTAVKPGVTVAGRAAEVTGSFLLPLTYGLYGVTYKLPPGTPDGIQPVTLTIAGQASNTVELWVGTTVSLATGGELGQAAPESIVTSTGCSGPLALGTFTGDWRNPPTILGGTTVRVRDSAGMDRPAPLYYVSQLQVNYVVPAGTAIGLATVTITAANGVASTAALDVQRVEPGVFVSGWHQIPAAWIVRVRDGVQTVESVADPEEDDGLKRIDPGPETDQVFLVLWGTGWRGRGSLAGVTLKLADITVPAEYAGPQNEFYGLDQVNVRVPRSLAGRGWVPIELAVEDKIWRGALAFK